MNRGSCKIRAGDYSGAIADLDRGIELSKKQPLYEQAGKLAGAYANRGMAKSLLGDLNGSLADHLQSINMEPTIPNMYAARALSLIKFRDFPRAIIDCRKARDLDRGATRNNLLNLFSQLLTPENVQAFERDWPDQ